MKHTQRPVAGLLRMARGMPTRERPGLSRRLELGPGSVPRCPVAGGPGGTSHSSLKGAWRSGKYQPFEAYLSPFRKALQNSLAAQVAAFIEIVQVPRRQFGVAACMDSLRRVVVHLVKELPAPLSLLKVGTQVQRAANRLPEPQLFAARAECFEGDP